MTGQRATIDPAKRFTDQISDLRARLAELERVAAKSVTAAQLAERLPVDGSLPMSGDLDLDGNKVTGWPVEAAFSTITAATNFTVVGSVHRWGSVAGVTVSVTRITSNVGAASATVGTFAAGGRGSFSSYTQALTLRAQGASALAGALCWIDVSTGQVSMQWFNTWTVGVTQIYNGVVLFGA